MLWIKTFHIIFPSVYKGTWFAGLNVVRPGHRPSMAGSGNAARGTSPRLLRSRCSHAAIHGGANSPALIFTNQE